MALFEDKGTYVSVSPDLKLISEFNEIIKRDKGSEGDSQGRRKLRASREFAYIYHFNDYRSPYQRYSEKERHERLKKDLDLGEKWDVDSVIRVAQQKYIELNHTPAIQALMEARQTLNTSAEVNRKIREQIMRVMDEDELDPETLQQANNLLEKTLDNNTKIPKVLTQIEGMEEKVKKQEQESGSIQGSEEKGYFEDYD